MIIVPDDNQGYLGTKLVAAKTAEKAAKKAFKDLWDGTTFKFEATLIKVTANGQYVDYSINNSDSASAALYSGKPGVAYGFADGLNIATDKFTVVTHDDLHWFRTSNTSNLKKGMNKTSTTGSIAMANGEKLVAAYRKWKKAQKKTAEALKAYKGEAKTPKVVPPGSINITPPVVPSSSAAIWATTDTHLKYNLGAVHHQYFRDNGNLFNKGTPENSIVYMAGGNAPVKRIKNAQEAFSGRQIVSTTKGKKTTESWEDVATPYASKGIIQSMVKPAKIESNTSGSTAVSPEGGNKYMNTWRMGFQFHYNPSTIRMQWQGSPNVDIGYVISGKDKFGPIGSDSSTGSGFTLDIPINRMADMRLVNQPEGNWDKINWEKVYGIAVPEKSAKGKEPEGQSPDYNDLRKIRDLGTMYDVEFLLRTLMGYQLTSAIRLGAHTLTSDLGYLGGFPVEIHLGKNMRYYVSITSISTYHSMFTKDMVPIMSTLSLNCSRIPDYTPGVYSK